MPDSLWNELNTFAEQSGRDLSEIARSGLEREVKGVGIAEYDPAIPSRAYRAKFLTRAPAGPWEEAISHAGEFLMSEQTADYLEARDGDVIVGVIGESMEGKRLCDGDLLLMRPVAPHRQPVRGEIVLIQMWDESGNHTSTIKEWRGLDGDTPKLVDGNDEPFEVPTDAVGFRAVAVAKGLVARL